MNYAKRTETYDMSSATLKLLIDKNTRSKERPRGVQEFWLRHKIKSAACKISYVYTSYVQFEIPNIENSQYKSRAPQYAQCYYGEPKNKECKAL